MLQPLVPAGFLRANPAAPTLAQIHSCHPVARRARGAPLVVIVSPLLWLPTSVCITSASYTTSERNGVEMRLADAHFSGATKDVLKTPPDNGSIDAGHCQNKNSFRARRKNATSHTLEPLQATGQDAGSMPTLALPYWSLCAESEGSRVLKHRTVDVQNQTHG